MTFKEVVDKDVEAAEDSPIGQNTSHSGETPAELFLNPVYSALWATFTPNCDPTSFGKAVHEALQRKDQALLDAAAKSRLRFHDYAYELLEARELLSDEAAKLDTADVSVMNVGKGVASALETLRGCMQARQNLDHTLEIISRTRALVRMFDRAESMISSNNLHGALRMLDRLDESLASADSRDVILRLVPLTRPLRANILAHVRRYLHAWLSTVRAEIPSIGNYVIALQMNQNDPRATSHLLALSDSVIAKTEQTEVVSGLAERSKRPWFPPIRVDDRVAGIAHPSKSRASLLAESMSVSDPISKQVRFGNVGSNIDGSFGKDGRVHAGVSSSPCISMRLLLTCLLACEDMDRMDDFLEEYEKERMSQFSGGLESILSSFLVERNVHDSISVSVLEKHQSLLFYIAGFIVSEYAAEQYSKRTLLSRTAKLELWRLGKEKLPSYSKTGAHLGNAGNAQQLRKACIALSRVARVYGFEN